MKTNNERECSRLSDVLPEVMKDIQELSEGKRKSRAPKINNRRELERLLKQNGIRKNSKNWRDYSRAKWLFTGGFFIDHDRYHKLIEYTLGYLGL